MNRTIEDAMVKRYNYETHDRLKEHFSQFPAAYNFTTRLQDTSRANALSTHQ